MILYGKGMHQAILDEAELGFRVACWLDEENNTPEEWWGGLMYEADVRQLDEVDR